MEAKAIYSKKNLEFFLTSLPAEAAEWAETRAVFERAIEHLAKVIDHCEKEAHSTLRGITPKELECPCPSCKTERMLEVLENLDREELLLIIQGEQAIATEPHVACVVKAKEDAVSKD
ncbi:MAG: hypothetical protein ACOYNN_18885 [Terrimicrobiaceae bacterium]